MNNDPNLFFGWQMHMKILENSLNKESDVIIALIHFLLIKRRFSCVGLGESKTLEDGETGSEMLPNGWSDDSKYAIRYVFDKNIYVLMGNSIEDSFLVNFLTTANSKVSNIALISNDLVKRLNGTLEQVLPTANELVMRLQKELIDPVFTGTTKDTSSQTTIESRDPLQVGVPRRPRMPDGDDDFDRTRPRMPGQFAGGGYEPRPFGFPDVGRSDLDPLASFGSGNLLQFPQRPFGVANPRFDPTNPFGPNGPQRPNPDHFRPPTFGDFDII